jgi:methylated-DNA-[protein]-cysteine S-methyltransferase
MYVTAYLNTPIGYMAITGSELGIRTLQLFDAEKGIPATPDLPETHPVSQCVGQLKAYFAGVLLDFDVQLDWGGTSDFHRLVWAELRRIPYGQTVSYSDIATRIGHPSAVRAVGLANRSNPIAIVVPCHRVIGKSGELRGYFYGLDTKMQLLRLENPVRFAEQGELF